jgi:hypothetical protein
MRLAVDLRPRGRTGCPSSRSDTQVGRSVRAHDGACVPVGGRSSGSWMWHRLGAALSVASRIPIDPVPVTGSSPHTAAGQRRIPTGFPLSFIFLFE